MPRFIVPNKLWEFWGLGWVPEHGLRNQSVLYYYTGQCII